MALLRVVRAVIAGALIIASVRPVHAQAAGEYQIKAAFLQTFAKFVEWPATALPPSAPLVIGVVGDDPFGDTLARSIHGASADGHPFILQHFAWNESLAGCHILFIAASELQHLSEILGGLASSSTLTVGDFDSFARRGGAIELRMIEGRVRFEINLGAAASAGLHISSRLLSLAVVVYGQQAKAHS